MTKSGRVLLTGATGFVGMEVLARYLERSDRPVTCLVRAGSDSGAHERVEGVLRNLFGRGVGRYMDRVHAFAGELTEPHLGLSPASHEALAEEVTTIVHCAASVSFAMPLSTRLAVSTSMAPGGCWNSLRLLRDAVMVWTVTPRSQRPM